MINRLIYIISFFQLIFAQGAWYNGNLKGIDNFTMELNIKGLDDGVWEKRVYSFVELRFLENDIRIVKNQMPKPCIGLWCAYKEIIPAIIKEAKNADYILRVQLPK